ncbi:MAG: PEP-CTERM sorting domain-containing protein [Phycisphaerales bacterium]|nr:PEP-CTERM sorting domain-containing protein [Phycisphaerales bacterium]
MKNTVLLIALAGLTTAAMAEDFVLSIAGAPATIDATNGATITIDIIGDSTHGEYMMGGAFSMASGSSFITGMSWTPASWSAFNTDNGYAGNGDYNLVVFGQLSNQGPAAPGSELGMVIGSFQIQIAAGSVGVIDLEILGGLPFALETAFWLFDGFPTGGAFDVMNSSNGNLILNGASINVVPAPSSLALLGLGGLAIGRRRR